MQQNEYLTVKEISKKYDMSARNIRRIISNLTEDFGEETLYKDKNHQWQVHRVIVEKFKPKRIRKNKYYALSIDPCDNYTKPTIEAIVKLVFAQMGDEMSELNYTIEQKKSNNLNHLHCFVKCANKQKLIRNFRLEFSRISFRQSPVFDIDGWMNYITKDGCQIKTLKK